MSLTNDKEISDELAKIKISERRVLEQKEKDKQGEFLIEVQQMRHVENNHAFIEYQKNKEECLQIRNKFANRQVLDLLVSKYDVFLKTHCNNSQKSVDEKKEDCKRMFDSEWLVKSFGNTKIYARITFTNIQKEEYKINVLDKQFPIEVNFVIDKDYSYDTDADTNNKDAEEYVKKLVRQCNYQVPIVVKGETNPHAKVRYQYLEYNGKTNQYDKVSCLLDLKKIIKKI